MTLTIAPPLTEAAFEEWRPCPDYDGVYEVSSLGRVRRIGVSSGARPGRLIASRLGRFGYRTVNLSFRNQPRMRYVHSLVCRAFIGERPWVDAEVNHLDGDKSNNHPTNLEWVTRLENAQHAAQMGLYKHGAFVSWAKLSEESVREIRRLRGVVSQRALARRYAVAQSTVRRVQQRKRWRHVE